jgi:hypothetical protein
MHSELIASEYTSNYTRWLLAALLLFAAELRLVGKHKQTL